MPWGYAAAAVGTIVASNSQSKATQAASNTSSAASSAATAGQERMFSQQRADQAPWMAAGKNALAQGTQQGGQYMKPFSTADFKSSPGYAFRQKQGMKALEQSAAGRGGVLSGNMLRGAQAYGQGLASQEYQNAYNRYNQDQNTQYNRLAGIAGTGQNAAQNIGAQGSQMAANVGNIGMMNANTNANAQLAAGQSRASMYQGLGNIAGQGMYNDNNPRR